LDPLEREELRTGAWRSSESVMRHAAEYYFSTGPKAKIENNTGYFITWRGCSW